MIYEFIATITIDGQTIRTLRPKGFYYQGKRKQYIILVGDEETGSTTRIKYRTEDVDVKVVGRVSYPIEREPKGI